MEVTYGTWCHSRGDLLGRANTVWCQVRLGQNRYDSKSLRTENSTKNTQKNSQKVLVHCQIRTREPLLALPACCDYDYIFLLEGDF